MGVTAVADVCFQDKLTSITKAGEFKIGVLIGQNIEDKYYLLHIAPSPRLEDEDLASENEDKSKKENKANMPESISSIDTGLVSQHARQVVRMLPGGLDIIGIFVATPQADFSKNSSQAKIQTILSAINKVTSTPKVLLGKSEFQHNIILHICTQTQKYSLKVTSISQPTVLPASLELKFQRGGIQWQQLCYSYKLDLTLWIPRDKSSLTLHKLIANLIKPWAQSVSESVILIDGSLMDNDQLLLDAVSEERTHKKKGVGRGGMDIQPPKVIEVDFLEPCSLVKPVLSGKEESSGCVKLNGTVAGCAFLQAKAKAVEAFDAVQIDLIRSIISRWEMHCDSLVEEPQASTGPIFHEPPRRVFLEGGGLPVSLCDYLFPGDTVADACQSALELLDVLVHEENVDDSLEMWTDLDCQALGVGSGNHSNSVQDGNLTNTGATRWTCSPAHILLAVGIATIGVGLSYISLMGSKALS